MAHIKMSFYTKASAEYVFDYIAEPDNMPAWNSNFVANKDRPEGPIAVGTSWTQVSRMGGRTIEFRRRVLKYERPHRIVWEMAISGRRVLLAFELEPQGNGTKATYTADYTLPGSLLGRFTDKLLLESRARKDTARNIAKLKAILQKGAPKQFSLLKTK